MRQDTSPRGRDQRGSRDDGGLGRFRSRRHSVNLRPPPEPGGVCGLTVWAWAKWSGTADSFETRGRGGSKKRAQCQKEELVQQLKLN